MKTLDIIRKKIHSLNDKAEENHLVQMCKSLIPGKQITDLVEGIMILQKGKSPPGRSRSPGGTPGGMNIHMVQSLSKNLIFNNLKQLFQFSHQQYSSINNNLIFKVMKKQILLLVMALFASATAFGQVVCPTPRAVDATCLTNDALHPMPGTPYNYIIDVPTPPGAKEFTWLVTQDKNFITAPGTLTPNRETTSGSFLAQVGTGYNDPATGTNTVSLTWKSFTYDPANPVFVVIQVRNAVTGECNTNNLKVYKIEPINAFTLDIANVGADKTTVSNYETPIDRCISDVVSATYDPTAPEGVRYDFGVDYLYYVVTAANFTTSWQPSFQLSGLDPKETVTAVEWFRPTDNTFSAPNNMTLAAGVYTADNPVLALDASGTVGSGGECIVIRVTVDHTNGANQYEGLADETITAAVDGKTQLASASPVGDIHFSKTVGNAADCGLEDLFRNDIAVQTLKARPAINAGAAMPAPGLLPVK